MPFVLSGIVVCLCLTRFPDRANRLYAVDLIGAGLGCVLLVALFSWFDGPSLVIFIGALAVRRRARCFAAGTRAPDRRCSRSGSRVVLALGSRSGTACSTPTAHAVVRVRLGEGSADPQHDYERWNAFSRLTVDGDPSDPGTDQLASSSTARPAPSCSARPVTRTRATRATSSADEIENLVHNIRQPADVAVIGVGGGRTCCSALEFEQRSVTGIEINGDIIDIVNGKFGDFTGHLDRDPRVDDRQRRSAGLPDAHGPERSTSSRSPLIDTWAATVVGRVRAERELALHDAGVEHVLRPTQRRRCAVGLALLPNDRCPTGRGPAARDVPHGRARRGGAHRTWRRQPARPHPRVSGADGLRRRSGDHAREPGAVHGASDLATSRGTRRGVRLHARAHRGRRRGSDARPAHRTRRARTDAVGELAADISPPTDNRPFFFQMADLGTFFDRGIWHDDYVTRPVLVLGDARGRRCSPSRRPASCSRC